MSKKKFANQVSGVNNGNGGLCLVLDVCEQKIAEAKITLAALNDINGLCIKYNPVTGELTALIDGVAVPIQLEFCCNPGGAFFTPGLLTGKIINCGYVSGALLIRNLETGIVITCVNLALTFHEELEAEGVLPTDFARETVVEDEGTAICVVIQTNPFTALPEPYLFVKCAFIVRIVVTREVFAALPSCPPLGDVCPTVKPTKCPPVFSKQAKVKCC